MRITDYDNYVAIEIKSKGFHHPQGWWFKNFYEDLPKKYKANSLLYRSPQYENTDKYDKYFYNIMTLEDAIKIIIEELNKDVL